MLINVGRPGKRRVVVVVAVVVVMVMVVVVHSLNKSISSANARCSTEWNQNKNFKLLAREKLLFSRASNLR